MEADFDVEGDLVEGSHVQPSGAIAGIFACRKCLSRIYTTNNLRPGVVNLRAGTLDLSPTLTPFAHFWTSQKQPWVILPENAPALETQPATPEDWLHYLVGAKS